MAQPLLTFEDVTLVRGLQVVVQEMNLTLEPGQVLCLKGENGAGKTSVLRAAAQLLSPFAGRVTVSPDLTIRYLGHDLALKMDQRPGEILGQDSLESWDLLDLAHVPLAYLSSGQKKRVALAHRCSSGARLWLMDEPFANLDAAQSDRLRQVIDTHVSMGGAALCSVHGEELSGSTLQLRGARAYVI